VHATARSHSSELASITGVTIHQLDVTDKEDISRLAEFFSARKLDIVLHNAGVGKGTPRDLMIKVNVDAPFDVITPLLPALARNKGCIAIVSSQLGSREKFGGGSTPTDDYGASKCLLNDRFREREGGWREMGLTSVVFHPGWVVTDMGGPRAPLTIQESSLGLKEVLDVLQHCDSGKFFNWDGTEHPW
jgi:NAD(P)-dependent dehydrogenase (short-subunit alcohol dehydrogenase family)